MGIFITCKCSKNYATAIFKSYQKSTGYLVSVHIKFIKNS